MFKFGLGSSPFKSATYFPLPSSTINSLGIAFFALQIVKSTQQTVISRKGFYLNKKVN